MASSISTSSPLPSSSSSYEEDGEVVLKVPQQFMEFSLGFVVDAGGSVGKVLYRSKKDYKSGKLIKPSDHGLLRLRYFNMADVRQINDFLKENCDVISTGSGSGSKEVTWFMTGVTTQHFKANMEKMFGIKIKLYSEMMALQNCLKLTTDLGLHHYDVDLEAFDFAAKRFRIFAEAFRKFKQSGDTSADFINEILGYDDEAADRDLQKLKVADFAETSPPKLAGPLFELLASQNDKEWIDKYMKLPTDQFITPSVVMIYGSAAATLLVNDEYKVKGIDFTGAAGKTLSGLVEEMIGETDFDKFMEMASRGNLENVTILVRDLKNFEHTEEDWYAFFPDDTPALELGKLTSANAKGKGTYSKDDLAAGILNLQAAMISKFALHNCMIHKVFDAYFCGSLMRYEITRRMITKNFLSESFTFGLEAGQIIRPHFLHHPGFLVGLGVWAANVDLNKTN